MTAHERVYQLMKEMAEKLGPAGSSLVLPSPSNETLGTRYVDVEPGKSLTARFPFNAKLCGPLGIFHGGFLAACIDDVYGPLTYLTAQAPVVTIEMSTSYVRPFSAKDEYVEVRAEVVSHTRSLMVLRAEARTKEGKLVATSTTHSLVVQPKA